MRFHKNNGGVTLLDELENGINKEIMELMLGFFQENQENHEEEMRQFILTTHNTVLLDYIKPENIRYVVRNAKGDITAYNLFANQKLREKLEYMYPGEIILDTPNEEMKNLCFKDDCL
jgi:AAA15 family ATPase/GTPase